MSQTILLVGHGSRDADGNEEVEDFAAYWRSKRPQERIEVCFVEFAEVLVPEGLTRAAKGSTQVVVVPFILNAAGHVKMEIPEYIQTARKQFPDVAFLCARHLGCNEPILKLLRMRLHSAMLSLDLPDPKNSGVILLGRGSSDMSANGEVAKMARWVYETTRHDWVDYAFTGITYPRLETVAQRMAAHGMMQLIILPYYLFTGRLIKRIGRQVARLQQQYPHLAIAKAGYLGVNDTLVTLVDQRMAETVRLDAPIMLECDGCKFREIAQFHIEHQPHAH